MKQIPIRDLQNAEADEKMDKHIGKEAVSAVAQGYYCAVNIGHG